MTQALMFEQRTEGEQRSDPKNMSLWHVDYFGLEGPSRLKKNLSLP